VRTLAGGLRRAHDSSESFDGGADGADLTDAGICLALKEAYWQQVKGDIGRIIQRHGALTDEYWAAVRQLGISYWAEWSRDDLFDLTLVKRP